MEIHSETHGFEPFVPTARTKPIKADEVLFMFKLSKPPGGREWHLANRALSLLHTPVLSIAQYGEHTAAQQLSAREHLWSWHWHPWE